jgi:hypothetical protein
MVLVLVLLGLEERHGRLRQSDGGPRASGARSRQRREELLLVLVLLLLAATAARRARRHSLAKISPSEIQRRGRRLEERVDDLRLAAPAAKGGRRPQRHCAIASS